jgi:hypothetical protein
MSFGHKGQPRGSGLAVVEEVTNPNHGLVGHKFSCLCLGNITKMSLYIINNDHNENS